MGRKLLLSSIIIIVIGLFLLVYSDPQFRLIFATGGTAPGGSGFPTTGFNFRGNGTFRNFNGTIPRTLGSGRAAAAILGFNAISIIEALLGVALIAVGLVFVGIEMFLSPSKVVAPKQP